MSFIWKYGTEFRRKGVKKPDSAIPAMQQMAYDHLSIPAMSSEIERAFSGAKLNLPASRNQLRPDILEAQECVRRWLKAGL
jgi:hypothetical protein